MSTTLESSKCAQCNKSATELLPGITLKQCAKCKSVYYCSKDCQKAAWPLHKLGCKMPLDTPQRAVCRMNWFAIMNGASLNPLADEIFYLRTSRPYIHDISISGPFDRLETLFPNLIMNMSESAASVSAFEEITENARLINHFCHVVGPLTKDPSKNIMVELIRVQDADLKAQLPAPVWNVTRADLKLAKNVLPRTNTFGGAHVKELNIEGSYTNEETARNKAREVLEREARFFPNSQTHELPHEAGSSASHSFVAVPNEQGGFDARVAIAVTYDSGEEINLLAARRTA